MEDGDGGDAGRGKDGAFYGIYGQDSGNIDVSGRAARCTCCPHSGPLPEGEGAGWAAGW
jgi:hypothetical protein